MTLPFTVVPINRTESRKDRKGLEFERFQKLNAADQAIVNHLMTEGLLDRSPAYGAPPSTELERLLGDQWRARCAYVTFFEGRIRHLERVLRVTFESEFLSDEQRLQIIAVLHGESAAKRDSKLLSDTERRLIANYRDLDSDGKLMLRTLLARLVPSSGDDERGER
jgi:hypothetical protein